MESYFRPFKAQPAQEVRSGWHGLCEAPQSDNKSSFFSEMSLIEGAG